MYENDRVKSTKASERLDKMKNLKNKSIVSEFFIRSSSGGSLERQASCDSCTYLSTNLSHMYQHRRVFNHFQPPVLFNLPKNSTNTLLSMHQKYQSSSSSGVSTLKSNITSRSKTSVPKQSSTSSYTNACPHHKHVNTEQQNIFTSVIYDSYMEFSEFIDLFKSFYIHMRKDLKEIYDRYATLCNCKDYDDNVENTIKSMVNHTPTYKNSIELTRILTRNTTPSKPVHVSKNQLPDLQKQLLMSNNNRLFYDLISSNSISPYSVNCNPDLMLLNYYSHSNSQNSVNEPKNTTVAPKEFYAITVKQFKVCLGFKLFFVFPLKHFFIFLKTGFSRKRAVGT
jgi:hypothetical protein